MSSDPSSLAGSPTVFTLLGVDYRLHPFRFRDIAEFHGYVKELHPDPRIVAREHMRGLPDAVATHIWDRACEEAKEWPPAMDGPEMNSAIATPEGQARLVYIALRRTVAGMTLDQARDIAERMDLDDLTRLMDVLMPRAKTDPKAPATEAAPTSTGSPSSSDSA